MIFTSLNNMTISRFIYVAINGIISFFSMAEQYSIVCVCVCVCVCVYTHIYTTSTSCVCVHIHTYTPHLHPFACQWTFRVFLSLGYC